MRRRIEPKADRERREIIDHLPNAVADTFRLMAVAERAIEQAEREHPGLDADFAALVPPLVLRGKAEVLYEHHCRELLDRQARGADMRPGTDAECLAALSELSLRAPPGQALAALQEELFGRVFPGRVVAGDPIREPWPGRSDEILAELRRKLAVAERGRKQEGDGHGARAEDRPRRQRRARARA